MYIAREWQTTPIPTKNKIVKIQICHLLESKTPTKVIRVKRQQGRLNEWFQVICIFKPQDRDRAPIFKSCQTLIWSYTTRRERLESSTKTGLICNSISLLNQVLILIRRIRFCIITTQPIKRWRAPTARIQIFISSHLRSSQIRILILSWRRITPKVAQLSQTTTDLIYTETNCKRKTWWYQTWTNRSRPLKSTTAHRKSNRTYGR